MDFGVGHLVAHSLFLVGRVVHDMHHFVQVAFSSCRIFELELKGYDIEPVLDFLLIGVTLIANSLHHLNTLVEVFASFVHLDQASSELCILCQEELLAWCESLDGSLSHCLAIIVFQSLNHISADGLEQWLRVLDTYLL